MAQEFQVFVDTVSFGSAMRRLSELNQKTQAENLLRYARTTLVSGRGAGLLEITPPGSQGTTGRAAMHQGERAIDRDLAAVFTPVVLKGKRKEQYPDVAGIHLRLFQSKRSNAKLRSDKGRAFYHVDVRKLDALRVLLKSHVGRLAAGWVAAANRVGAPVPAWVARHGGGRGTVRITLSDQINEIEMTCFAPDNAPVSELQRRVPYAIEYATNRAEREINFLLAKDAKEAGFEATA